MSKVFQQLAITTVHGSCLIQNIDYSDNSNTVQFGFKQFLACNFLFVFSTIMGQHTFKERNVIFWLVGFLNHFVNGCFAKACSHVFDKDTTVPTIPLVCGTGTQCQFNSITGIVSSKFTFGQTICQRFKGYPRQSLSIWTTKCRNFFDAKNYHWVVAHTKSFKELRVT